MNPLNRKMFRQPGVSRQPTGILASSPQLANAVRRRMNQPVQMAHGGYHPPGDPMGRLSTSRRPVPGKVRIPLVDLLPKSGFARPALDNFLASASADVPSSSIGEIRGKVTQDALTDLAMQSIRRGGSPFSEEDDRGSRRTPDEVARSRGPALAAISANKPQGTTLAKSSLLDQGIAAAKSAVSGDYMRPLTDAIVRGVGSDISSIASSLADTRMSPANVAARARTPTMDDNVDDAAMLQAEMNRRAAQDRASEFVSATQPTAAEELAALRLDPKVPPEGPPTTATATDGKPRKVSTTDPEKKPNVNRNKLNDLLTLVQNNSPEQVSKVGPKLNADEAATPEAAEALKQYLPEESSLSDMEAMAKKITGFDPSKSKEAKRDSFWRNLTMAGLAIAAGESDNALTNVAKGLMVGMDSYSKDIKDINAQEAEERKEYRATLRDLIKTDKDSAIAMATLKNNHAYRVADLNQRRDQFKSTQDFQRAKLELDNSLANKQLEVQITTSLATLDLKQETLDEAKKQNAITNSQTKLKNMPAFQQTAVGLKYLVLDDESGEYEWTDEGQAWIDRNASAILAASITGSKSRTGQAFTPERFAQEILMKQEGQDNTRDEMIRRLPQFTKENPPSMTQMKAYLESVDSGFTSAPTTATDGNIPSYDSAPDTQTLEALSKQGVTQINVGGQLFNITSQ